MYFVGNRDPFNSKEGLPWAGSSVAGEHICGKGTNSVLMAAGEEERGYCGKPHWDCPPWDPTEAHQSPLHPEASPGLAGMLWLLLTHKWIAHSFWE